MGIKNFMREHLPYYILPAARALFRAIKPKNIPPVFSEYIKRAEKIRPLLQDELSGKILDDRKEYLMTGDMDVFIRRAFTEGFSFSYYAFFTEGHKHLLTLTKKGGKWYLFKKETPDKEEKCSGAVILYDKEGKNLERAKMLLATCPPLKNYRLMKISELSQENGISEYDIVINAVTVINPVKLMLMGKYIRHLRYFISSMYFSSNVLCGESESQYFGLLRQYVDVFTANEGETVLDVGACDGATSVQFLEWGGDKIRRVYAFEFDPLNLERCRENIKGFADKITLIEKGAWDKDDVMYIDTETVGSGLSHVSGSGKFRVQLSSIDNVMKDEPVTFIKMDIEGAELKALIGAKNTIIKNRPRLAISIYHKPEDICEIPEYILSLVPEYKFYMRHYSSSSAETILYAYC